MPSREPGSAFSNGGETVDDQPPMRGALPPLTDAVGQVGRGTTAELFACGDRPVEQRGRTRRSPADVPSRADAAVTTEGIASGEPTTVSNPDVYAYALFRLGGASRFVDLEDIYVECWHLSPPRFGWRKYDYPNHEFCAAARRDFEKAHPNLFVRTPDGLSRRLTADGIRWIRARLSALEVFAGGASFSRNRRSTSRRLIGQLERTELGRAAIAGHTPKLDKAQAAELFNCAPGSSPSVWRRRVAALRAAAQDARRWDLLSLLDGIQAAHPEWFGGADE